MQVQLKVNGKAARIDVQPNTLLVYAIREHLKLTGTHVGCDTAQCGCCTVLLDGSAVKSCSVLALQAQGRSVTSVEGLTGIGGRDPATLHPVQDAFIACHGLQCGFCTPGMMMAATALLNENPDPSDVDIVAALEGNLCRCTGYVNIGAAVRQAARTLATDGAAR